jgi:hypothetical protein
MEGKPVYRILFYGTKGYCCHPKNEFSGGIARTCYVDFVPVGVIIRIR